MAQAASGHKFDISTVMRRINPSATAPYASESSPGLGVSHLATPVLSEFVNLSRSFKPNKGLDQVNSTFAPESMTSLVLIAAASGLGAAPLQWGSCEWLCIDSA